MPIILTAYFISDAKRKKYLITTIFSFLISSIVYAVKAFFIFRTDVFYDIFLVNYLKLLLVSTVIPLAIIICLIGVIFNTSLQEKVNNFFAATLPFYAVSIPYEVISESVVSSPFLLVIKPLIYVEMVFSISTIIKMMYNISKENDKNKKLKLLLYYLELIFIILLPSLIENIYKMDKYFYDWLIVFIIYTIIVIIIANEKYYKILKYKI